MAVLNIRNLPDEVHARLRIRAARNHRSMEAEAREILAQACAAPSEPTSAAQLQAFVDALYQAGKPQGVTDDLIAQRRKEAAHE